MRRHKRTPVLGLAALVVLTAACHGDGHDSSPTQNESFRVAISGTLTPSSSIVSATGAAVFFDAGQAATISCAFPGCNVINVTASASSTRGPHTVAFQVN